MIRHENPGVQDPPPHSDHLRKQRHEAPAIGIIPEDVAPFVAAAGDMPDGTRKLEAKLAGHRGRREGRRREIGRCVGILRYHVIGGGRERSPLSCSSRCDPNFPPTPPTGHALEWLALDASGAQLPPRATNSIWKCLVSCASKWPRGTAASIAIPKGKHMKKLYYSINETKKPAEKRVHHNDTNCKVGRDIPENERRDGTGGYRLCEDCPR